MSIAAQLAQLTKLYISGSAAAAEALTAVTVGYPTILAITGHAGLANGDVVTFSSGFAGADAADLNGKTAVVKNYATGVTNDTFAVDINTVGKTITIGTATATPLDWVQIKEVKGINPSGASTSVIDVTDLDSTAKEFLTGLQDHGTLSFDINILETDAGQAACLAAFAASTSKNFKVVTTLPKTRTFAGSITKWPTVQNSSVDGVQTGAAEVKISGEVSVS